MYNGWSNYETWRVKTEFCDDLVESIHGEMQFGDEDTLAEYLESHTNTAIDVDASGLAADWARAFISDVNWREIAAAYVDDNPDLIEGYQDEWECLECGEVFDSEEELDEHEADCEVDV